MRGTIDPQGHLFAYFSPGSRVPVEHPLRGIKQHAEAALARISKELDAQYSHTGRPSIAPERLLKGQLLMALYTLRSDRQFCEQLNYNLLFRWFLDMSLEEAGLDQSNFSRLRERPVDTNVARREQLLSAEHFTVDGTLIEAWVSLKSLKRKDGTPPKDGGDGTGMVDFRGEKRGNATHESSTDPEARLMRRGNGQPAKLCYGGHTFMENRSGLCVDILVTDATLPEPAAAKDLVQRQRRKHLRPTTLGADKGFNTQAFVAWLRSRGIAPHIARIDGRTTPGLDDRTTRHESYRLSQRQRKRVEESFGWLKVVGGMRKSRFIGKARTQMAAYLSATAYNLLRLSKLLPQPAT